MVVPKKILDKWSTLRSPGDAEKIVASMTDEERVSDETIRRVYKDGKCNDEVFKAMAAFYEQKVVMIKEHL